jgi:hypothetical protein
MGALDLLFKAGAKKVAPFFSKADVVLDELQRGKGTGDEFLTELVKKGVKPTELKDRGLDKALKGKPKMTKAEVQQVFKEKAPPRVREEIRGGYEYQRALDEKAQEMIGDENVGFDDLYGRDKDRAEAAVQQEFGYDPETQYEKFKTPGGENYREILLKLPKRGLNEIEQRNLMLYEGDIRRGKELDPWHQKQYSALKEKEAAGSQDYFAPHFEGTPNLLAHVRVQDFKTPDGKKVLLVDEIQSDWHQAGRDVRNKEIKRIMNETGVDKKTASAQVPDDFGYGAKLRNGWKFQTLENGEVAVYGPDMQAPYGVTSGGPSNAQSEAFKIADKYGGVMTSTVPDAPFKKNWHEMAMKRVLDYAAENGYDTVAITPGKTQIDRYEEALRKNIDSLEYEPYVDDSGKQMFEVAGFKDGKQVFTEEDVTPDRLQDLIGKDTAQKISEGFGTSLAQERPMRPEWKRIESPDLSIGGEGMKGFYDKILPDYLNNYGKQYGAQVGTYNLPRPPKDSTLTFGYPGAEEYVGGRTTWNEFLAQNPKAADEFYTTVHAFDITPQMREQIQTKGQPLYSKIGVPGAEATAGAGAATMGSQMFDENNEQSVQNPVHFTENPDAMLLELMQRN